MVVFALTLCTYFFVTSGTAYNLIKDPPAVGATRLPDGRQEVSMFVQYRLNAQYIMEGLCGGFFYTLGGLGLVLLDVCRSPKLKGFVKGFTFKCGAFAFLLSIALVSIFVRFKMPNYLQY
eukprot:CAMPEP_0175077904 /NCGR_PEP_ID=MMETSP0052_2-20121109/23729_1 /TAXON_ID=51329 ORGANISM="Polytomella parva, Strain SAG 63-3" /NCGR_SAMPLE_ID=MMETSP0052_2 /ASSEMBLY_ACC=CAM_ASM_000194 /LENGTH=119 /DNA_ID=CAMNT_0016347581 /DNA_START=129 /DNA_END=488 /DNA_ORIENTATION=+